MRNSELGCSGTEQRRGVAVALSYGDAATRGRWRGAEVAQGYGGVKKQRRCGAGLRIEQHAVLLVQQEVQQGD